MSALILIELNGSEVSANSRAAITAASELTDSIDALVLTNDATNSAPVAALSGINTVKMIVSPELEHPSVEVASKLVAEVMSGYKYLVSGSSTFSKNISPRVGAHLMFSLYLTFVKSNQITLLCVHYMQETLWQQLSQMMKLCC